MRSLAQYETAGTAHSLSDTYTYLEVRARQRVNNELAEIRERSIYAQLRNNDQSLYEAYNARRYRHYREQQDREERIRQAREQEAAAREALRAAKAAEAARRAALNAKREAVAAKRREEFTKAQEAAIRSHIDRYREEQEEIRLRIEASREELIRTREAAAKIRKAKAEARRRQEMIRARSIEAHERSVARRNAEYGQKMTYEKQAELKRLERIHIEACRLAEERKQQVIEQRRCSEEIRRLNDSRNDKRLEANCVRTAKTNERERQAILARKAEFQRLLDEFRARVAAELEAARQKKQRELEEKRAEEERRAALNEKRFAVEQEEFRLLHLKSVDFAQRMDREKMELEMTEQARKKRVQEKCEKEAKEKHEKFTAKLEFEKKCAELDDIRLKRNRERDAEQSRKTIERVEKLREYERQRQEALQRSRHEAAEALRVEKEKRLREIMDRERRWITSEAARYEKIRLKEIRAINDVRPLPLGGITE